MTLHFHDACTNSPVSLPWGPPTLQVKLFSLTVWKTARKTELNVFWHSTVLSSGLSAFCHFYWVSWDDAIVVSAGKLRKLWDSPSELRCFLCVRTFLRPELLPVKTAQFTQFFPSGMTSHSKITQFNWESVGCFSKLLVARKWSGVKTESSLYHDLQWVNN
jgi:hypothetical protein